MKLIMKSYHLPPLMINPKIDYNAYKFDGTKTIAEIENIKKPVTIKN